MNYSKYKFLLKNNFVRYYILDNDALNPCICAYEKSPANKRQVGPWKLQRHVVHFVLQGSGSFTYNNETKTVKAGDIFAIVPNKMVSYMQNPEDPWTSIWFELTGSECAKLFNSVGLNENNLILSVNDFAKFEKLFLDLMQLSSNKNDQKGFLVISKIYQIFGELVEEVPILKESDNDNDLILSIIEHINANYSYNISSGSISKQFFISPQYLARIFAKYVGTTPSSYITSVRLKHAAQMLVNSNLPINTISETVGFANPYYFSSVFKKQYLFSPKRYRIVQRDLKKMEGKTIFS